MSQATDQEQCFDDRFCSRFQASFFKIDIDNPDVQTSLSSHEITGVVSNAAYVREACFVLLTESE